MNLKIAAHIFEKEKSVSVIASLSRVTFHGMAQQRNLYLDAPDAVAAAKTG